ncbi:MAG: GbsR/MarR family transcriptional regulator [Bacteroidota bacterium]
MADNKDLTQQIVADFAEGYSNFGLNPLMGRIVGLLIISKEPQSLDDIVTKLEMSKGPISQICRRLKERGLIEKVWVPGDRKDYYQASDDIFGKAYANQINKMQNNIEIAEKYLTQAQSLDSEDAEYIRQQMEMMKSFYELMDEYNQKFVEAWAEKHKKITG